MIFVLSSASRPALGPTQPPVQWVPGALSPGVKGGRGVMLTTHPLLVPRSRTSRSYTSCHPQRLHGVRDTFTLNLERNLQEFHVRYSSSRHPYFMHMLLGVGVFTAFSRTVSKYNIVKYGCMSKAKAKLTPLLN
jgi:hypothetical protein